MRARCDRFLYCPVCWSRSNAGKHRAGVRIGSQRRRKIVIEHLSPDRVDRAVAQAVKPMWKGSTHAGERRFAKPLLDDRNELLVVAVAIARPQQIEHVVFHDVRIDNPCNNPVTRACGRIFRNGACALPKRLKFVDGIRWRRRDEAKIDTCIRHGEVKLGISPCQLDRIYAPCEAGRSRPQPGVFSLLAQPLWSRRDVAMRRP